MDHDKLLAEISFVKEPTALLYADRQRLKAGETTQVIEEVLERQRKLVGKQSVWAMLPTWIILGG